MKTASDGKKGGARIALNANRKVGAHPNEATDAARHNAMGWTKRKGRAREESMKKRVKGEGGSLVATTEALQRRSMERRNGSTARL